MREILFRGKRKDNGEWVKGFYVRLFEKENGFYKAKHYIFDGNTELGEERYCGHGNYEQDVKICKFEVIPGTVVQYTGLTDKNGKKIFEGDICRFREWSKGEMCWIGKVHWERQQFMISGGPNKECETIFKLCMSRFIPENIEVIGNIHDNPELLK